MLSMNRPMKVGSRSVKKLGAAKVKNQWLEYEEKLEDEQIPVVSHAPSKSKVGSNSQPLFATIHNIWSNKHEN